MRMFFTPAGHVPPEAEDRITKPRLRIKDLEIENAELKAEVAALGRANKALEHALDESEKREKRMAQQLVKVSAEANQRVYEEMVEG